MLSSELLTWKYNNLTTGLDTRHSVESIKKENETHHGILYHSEEITVPKVVRQEEEKK